jgi:hypothetical protein
MLPIDYEILWQILNHDLPDLVFSLEWILGIKSLEICKKDQTRDELKPYLRMIENSCPPFKIASRVDLPLPLEPIIDICSPCPTFRLISLRASIFPTYE